MGIDGCDPSRSFLCIGQTGVLSDQILGELFVTVTRKISPPLSEEEAGRSATNDAAIKPFITKSIALEAGAGCNGIVDFYRDYLM
jgi:hypothetical protein